MDRNKVIRNLRLFWAIFWFTEHKFGHNVNYKPGFHSRQVNCVIAELPRLTVNDHRHKLSTQYITGLESADATTGDTSCKSTAACLSVSLTAQCCSTKNLPTQLLTSYSKKSSMVLQMAPEIEKYYLYFTKIGKEREDFRNNEEISG